MLVRAPVEAEYILAGVPDKKHLHVRVHLKKEIKDAVVQLAQILRLVNHQDGYLALEPGPEGIIS